MPVVTRAPVLFALLVLLVATPAGVTAAPAAAGTAVPVGVWPLRPPPEVVRGFDPPDSRWGAGHRGVDLLGSPGVAVRAALPGVVSFAGRIAGRGVVVVDHGETRTTYEPVLAAVRRGRRVAAGAVLGHLASAGSHCPPRACLHWGWLRGVTYLDPLLLVGAGPVRLLPLQAPAPLASPGSWPRWSTRTRLQPCLPFRRLPVAGGPASLPHSCTGATWRPVRHRADPRSVPPQQPGPVPPPPLRSPP